MKGPLGRLIETHAGAGRLDWIGLRPARRETLITLAQARVAAGGLEGDHGRAGKRAVTLIQAEHLPVIGALAARDAAPPEMLRRNLVISGINLGALRGRTLRIGGAVLRITGPCAPCSRMEETLGRGGYGAVRHHGGWCASVVAPGQVALGDRVVPC